MDFDIEMEDTVVEPYPDQEPATQDILLEEDTQEPGEVDEDADGGTDLPSDQQRLVLNKIHIRGLDAFKPDDIKAYAREHYGAGVFERIEWIDDASANLLFGSDSTAAEALVALCAVEIADATQLPPLELLPAKPYSARPDTPLQVRFAVVGDRKQVGAASRSRFYLLNPEYDPEERRRRGDFDKGKYRDREGDRYRRAGRRREDRRDDRRDDAPQTFDASLYDDDEETLAKRESQRPRRDSRSPTRSRESSVERYAQRNRDKELFPSRVEGGRRNGSSARNRSASPARSMGGDVSMDDSRDRGAASRNRDRARSLKDRLSQGNSSKELFPSKASTHSSRAQMDKLDSTEGVVTRLSERITRPSESTFNIRGMASQQSTDQGFAIKGGASAKELFPDKLNSSAGKELFSDKLETRIQRRQRAEDLFH